MHPVWPKKIWLNLIDATKGYKAPKLSTTPIQLPVASVLIQQNQCGNFKQNSKLCTSVVHGDQRDLFPLQFNFCKCIRSNSRELRLFNFKQARVLSSFLNSIISDIFSCRAEQTGENLELIKHVLLTYLLTYRKQGPLAFRAVTKVLHSCLFWASFRLMPQVWFRVFISLCRSSPGVLRSPSLALAFWGPV